MQTITGPVHGSRLLATGLATRSTLRTRFQRVLPDVYVPRPTELTAEVVARAVSCWAGPGAVLTGWSAAAALGARWLPAAPVHEVALGHHRAAHPGLVVRQLTLGAEEVEEVDGVLVTTPVRTAYDLGRRLPLVEAVAAVDQLCGLGVCGPAAVADLAARHPGDRGLRRLRAALDLADPGAASPRETALRVLLLRAGLPAPQTQVDVRGTDGRFLARGDLGWRRWRVLVEYEGAQHRDGRQFARDVDRYHALEHAGWVVVRVTAQHLDRRPDEVVRRVADALRRRGAPLHLDPCW